MIKSCSRRSVQDISRFPITNTLQLNHVSCINVMMPPQGELNLIIHDIPNFKHTAIRALRSWGIMISFILLSFLALRFIRDLRRRRPSHHPSAHCLYKRLVLRINCQTRIMQISATFLILSAFVSLVAALPQTGHCTDVCRPEPAVCPPTQHPAGQPGCWGCGCLPGPPAYTYTPGTR